MIGSRITCVIDDNEEYRFWTQLYLQKHYPQHSTFTYSGGQAFLDALAGMDSLPNLILLDRHMPGLDGHQTLMFLKQHPIYKRIPVVMMSAHAVEEEIDGCYEAGANSFLRKQSSQAATAELLAAICRYWLELNQVPNLDLG